MQTFFFPRQPSACFNSVRSSQKMQVQPTPLSLGQHPPISDTLHFGNAKIVTVQRELLSLKALSILPTPAEPSVILEQAPNLIRKLVLMAMLNHRWSEKSYPPEVPSPFASPEERLAWTTKTWDEAKKLLPPGASSTEDWDTRRLFQVKLQPWNNFLDAMAEIDKFNTDQPVTFSHFKDIWGEYHKTDLYDVLTTPGPDRQDQLESMVYLLDTMIGLWPASLEVRCGLISAWQGNQLQKLRKATRKDSMDFRAELLLLKLFITRLKEADITRVEGTQEPPQFIVHTPDVGQRS